MQINILQKCIDELAKDNPKLDYIRGMLETLVEIQAPSNPVQVTKAIVPAAELPPVPSGMDKMQAMITTEEGMPQ